MKISENWLSRHSGRLGLVQQAKGSMRPSVSAASFQMLACRDVCGMSGMWHSITARVPANRLFQPTNKPPRMPSRRTTQNHMCIMLPPCRGIVPVCSTVWQPGDARSARACVWSPLKPELLTAGKPMLGEPVCLWAVCSSLLLLSVRRRPDRIAGGGSERQAARNPARLGAIYHRVAAGRSARRPSC
jgi:hypothetical protein